MRKLANFLSFFEICVASFLEPLFGSIEGGILDDDDAVGRRFSYDGRRLVEAASQIFATMLL
jgi:hypothetical protein